MFSECFSLNLLHVCGCTLRVYRFNENNVLRTLTAFNLIASCSCVVPFYPSVHTHTHTLVNMHMHALTHLCTHIELVS